MPALELLSRTFRDVGVAGVLLRAHDLSLGGCAVELLVRPGAARSLLPALDSLSWWHKLGGRGAWRLFPTVHYWWANGLNLDVYWRLLAAPLPSWTLRPVERALWDGAIPGPHGFLIPDAAALLVHRACQAARPDTFYHRADWEEFVACLPRDVDWDRVSAIAREAGVEGVVNRSIEAAENEDGGHGGPLFDRGMLGAAWRVAVAVQRRARPTSVAHFLAASSRLGEMTARCRVHGTEVLAGPGVFVPTPDAERFVRLTLEHVSDVHRPVVVEVGTGCGAVGLAIARTRPDADVHLTDLSRAAVWWTKRNRGLLGLRNIHVYRGPLLHPIGDDLRGRVAVVLANLPFYPAASYAAIGGVPRETIEGEDDDGLGLLRRLAHDAATLLAPRGRLLLQMFASQWEVFAPELVALGYHPGQPSVRGPFAICPADRG